MTASLPLPHDPRPEEKTQPSVPRKGRAPRGERSANLRPVPSPPPKPAEPASAVAARLAEKAVDVPGHDTEAVRVDAAASGGTPDRTVAETPAPDVIPPRPPLPPRPIRRGTPVDDVPVPPMPEVGPEASAPAAAPPLPDVPARVAAARPPLPVAPAPGGTEQADVAAEPIAVAVREAPELGPPDVADQAAAVDAPPAADPAVDPDAAADADPADVLAPPPPAEPEADAVLPFVDEDTVSTQEEISAPREPEEDPAGVSVLVSTLDAALDAAPGDEAETAQLALELRGVTKVFGGARAVDAIDLAVPAGSFYGLVGPNGAGKTTTLSMIAGLLRPDAGTIRVAGIDAKAHRRAATQLMGVLPDRLRTFDRLTGRQLLHYFGALRGLPGAVAESRATDLARAFDLTDALSRPVADYSGGMTKKIMLAGAMIHAPRVLVLDEPFESVDPVSSAVIIDILEAYVAHGGTVILSSHGMEMVERICTRIAVIVAGQVLAEGSVDSVRGELTLEQRFVQLAGGLSDVEGLEWLHTFSG